MRPRVMIGRFMIRFGKLIQSFAVSVMRPDDLMVFSRQSYAEPKSVEHWTRNTFVNSGLTTGEKALLSKVPVRRGRLLLLDVGGGREAIPLAQMGFDVTGVDFVPQMISRAIDHAARCGLKLTGIVQEKSRLNVPEATYDAAWLSAGMYSSIPTRARRIGLLKRIWAALKPGRYVVCEFQKSDAQAFSRKREFIRRGFTFLTLGNFWYERGDTLWLDQEFIHAFSSEGELRFEVERGGFEVVHMDFGQNGFRGGAVLKKAPHAPKTDDRETSFGTSQIEKTDVNT